MIANYNTPVITFVANSGSGKTTLLEKVIASLKSKRYKLAVIKHDAHHFDMDKPGKDTWRMTQAGADIVAISSPEKVALIEQVEVEKSLDEVIATLSKVDIILTEGFKRSDKPKIEISRSEVSRELLCEPGELLAIASDIAWDVGVPCHHINDIEAVVEMLSNSPCGRKAAVHRDNGNLEIGAAMVVSADQEGGFNLAGYTCSTPFDFRTVFYNMQGITALEGLA